MEVISPLLSPLFHGRLAREEAELLIYRQANSSRDTDPRVSNHASQDGTFLLRTTYSNSGDDTFVISVLFDRRVWHYNLLQFADNTFQLEPVKQSSGSSSSIPQPPTFPGPIELVEYYQSTSTGLHCCLSYGVLRASSTMPANLQNNNGSPNDPVFESPCLFWGVTAAQLFQHLNSSKGFSVQEARSAVETWYFRPMHRCLVNALNDLVSQLAWYVGPSVSRNEAQRRLSQEDARVGAFLVREANNRRCLAISLLIASLPSPAFKHYQLAAADGFVRLDRGPPFPSLVQLIDYYHNRPVSVTGLTVRLVYPCVRPVTSQAAPVQSPTTFWHAAQSASSSIQMPPSLVLKSLGHEQRVPSGANAKSSITPSVASGLSWIHDLPYYIPRDELILEHNLGKGNFGVVNKGIWVRDPSKYPPLSLPPPHVTTPPLDDSDLLGGDSCEIQIAVKSLTGHCPDYQSTLLKESDVMRNLRHRHISRFFGISFTNSSSGSSKILMVMEFAPFLDARSYLSRQAAAVKQCRQDAALPETEELLLLTCQIADAMKYLSDRSLIHRDLALRNILLKTPHHALLADFGMSRAVNVDAEYYTATSNVSNLPIRWYPLESIRFLKFSEKSDVWSFAVTTWELFSYGSTRPFADKTSIQMVEYLAQGKRLERPLACPPAVYALLLRCWSENPSNRPRFGEINDKMAAIQRSMSGTGTVNGYLEPR